MSLIRVERVPLSVVKRVIYDRLYPYSALGRSLVGIAGLDFRVPELHNESYHLVWRDTLVDKATAVQAHAPDSGNTSKSGGALG